jgi:hypothetical protein
LFSVDAESPLSRNRKLPETTTAKSAQSLRLARQAAINSSDFSESLATRKPSQVNPMKLRYAANLALLFFAIPLFTGCGSDSQSQQQLTCSNQFYPGRSTCATNNGFGGGAPMINQRIYMTPRNF